MSVADDLFRLERMGAENSAQIQKLKEACESVAQAIVKAVDPQDAVELPRGYEAWYAAGHHPWLRKLGSSDNIAYAEAIDRETALDFARDIATGWIEEVTAAIEERVVEARQAIEVLVEAKSKILS